MPPAPAVRGKSAGHDFLVRLAAALAAREQPVTMVIDDFHVLTDAGILDSLHYLLGSAAPRLHLVLSSSIEPLLPLHRYRLNWKLAEIRAEDLAFNATECNLMMAQHGVTLSACCTRAPLRADRGLGSGNTAGCHLPDGHPDPEQFVKALGAEDSAVTGYLVDEVLNAQPADLRDFLLRTSILDRINVGSLRN